MSDGERTPYEVLAVQVGTAKLALCGNANATHEEFRAALDGLARLRDCELMLRWLAVPGRDRELSQLEGQHVLIEWDGSFNKTRMGISSSADGLPSLDDVARDALEKDLGR